MGIEAVSLGGHPGINGRVDVMYFAGFQVSMEKYRELERGKASLAGTSPGITVSLSGITSKT